MIDLKQVKVILDKYEVPAEFYSIGGLGSGECMGIAREGGRWQTYFSEHGMKTSIKNHSSEAEACVAFLKALNSLLAEYGVDRNLPTELATAQLAPQ